MNSVFGRQEFQVLPVEVYAVEVAEVRVAGFAAIRLEVFVGEQHVPPDEEMDDLDATAIHVLASVDGQPIGTGRLIVVDAENARIGRMAVRKTHRGTGVGAAILDRLVDEARSRGIRTLTLSGQLHAIPFYERFGFVAHGDVYLDAGIEHRTMERPVD